MSFLQAKKICKTYQDDGVATPVLHDISFEIEEGEFVAIMGPSGSGKSTLLHIIGFLDDLTKGTYRFNGKRMQDYEEEEVAHIRNKEMGFVFQAFNLLSRTSVYENVRLPLLYSDRPQSDWDALTMKAINEVGLTHRMDHDSSQLSGGERQRVAIARALVNEPRVIFADEPTGNLDTHSGAMIMDILQKLNKEKNHTIVLITHESIMAEHARRILHVVDGRIDSDKKVRSRREAYKEFKK